jgi:hypothetical protein
VLYGRLLDKNSYRCEPLTDLSLSLPKTSSAYRHPLLEKLIEASLKLRSKGATVFWIANRGVQRGIRSWEEVQKSRLDPRRVCIGGSQDEGKLFSPRTEDH